MSKPHILITGSLALDRIMKFSGKFADLIEPAKLNILSVSVLADSLDLGEGGVAGNMASSMGYLGDHPILLGSIGPDGTGYIESLKDRGVNVDYINYSKLPTASFHVLTDSQDNQVGGFYLGASSDNNALSFEPWKDESAIACVSANEPNAMRRFVREAKEYSFKLIYDPAQQTSTISAEDLMEGIEAAHILIVNEYEFNLLCKRTELKLQDLIEIVPLLIITLGGSGSVMYGREVGDKVVIQRAPADKVVDPTGAGDSYRSGLMYGLARGWDYVTAAQFGSTVASFIVEEAGPQVKLDPELVNKRFNETYKKELAVND
jgi:adenosine kinase